MEGEFGAARQRESDMNAFFARVLQYLETPQYLRRMLFPVHPDLKYAGLLNPLDAPHHVRATTPCLYREGVVTHAPPTFGALENADEEAFVGKKGRKKRGCMVNVGLRKSVYVERTLPAGVRVTVKMDHPVDAVMGKGMTGKVVPPSEPREAMGFYWGYNVRLAAGISQVFTGCPYEGGYDVTVGTSERGDDAQSPSFKLKPFNHLLVLFGGLGGLEDCILGDQDVKVSDPRNLCDVYINTCRNQGSGTIRTEEAILVTMSVLHPHIQSNEKSK
eukprot:TRINITY_DN17687_c0_g1_i2.p2 TRINITY_DN17687_c0_g1~~TRINITY_DN17687_c0_g1_i2.p2  ORF type:complete len:274 (+),score=137.08 TRINITY_DN17687_c0_g1_i2:610-1431(+)